MSSNTATDIEIEELHQRLKRNQKREDEPL
jgi:hypothetical protein